MEPCDETSETPQKMDMNDLSNQSESTEMVQHQAGTMELFHMEALLSAQTAMTELLENGKAIAATNSTVPLAASENAILLAKHKSLVRVFKALKYLNAIQFGMSKSDTSSVQSAGQSAGAAVPSSAATASTTSTDNPENKSDALTTQDVSKFSSAITTATPTIASSVSTEHISSEEPNEPDDGGDRHNIIVPCFHIKDGLEHLLSTEEKARHEAEQRATLLAAQQQQQRNLHRPNPQPRQPRPAAVPFRRQVSADSLSIQGFSAIASYLDRIPFAMPSLTYVNRRESLPTTVTTTTSASSSSAVVAESTAVDGANKLKEASVKDTVRVILKKMVSTVVSLEPFDMADDATRLLKWEETWSSDAATASAIEVAESENKPGTAEGQKETPQLQCSEPPEESPPPLLSDGSQPTLQSDGQSQTPLQTPSQPQPQPETRPPNRVYMNLGDLGMREGWTTVWTNPCYCIDDCPVEGWRKEISVKINGKLRGSVDVYYTTPSRDKRIKNKSELQLYFSQNNLPFDQISLFNFAATFCVCQDIEKDDYIECSFGKSGCNGWIHPQCVSVDRAVENYNHDELGDTIDRVICPLCTLYLEATGDLAAHCDFDTMVMRCSDKLLEPRPPRQFIRPKRPLPTITASASAVPGTSVSSSNSFADSGQTSTFMNPLPMPSPLATLAAGVQANVSHYQNFVPLVVPAANSVTEINGFKVEEYSEYSVTQNEHYLINVAAILKAQEESDLRAVQLVLMDLVEAVARDGGEEGPTDLAGTAVVEPMAALPDGTSRETASSSLSTAPLSLLSPMQSIVASTMVKQPHIDSTSYSSLHSKRPLDSSATVTHNLLQQDISGAAFHSHSPAKPITPPSTASVSVAHNLFNPNTLLSSIITAPAAKRAKTDSAASLNNIFQHRLFQFNAVPVSSTTTVGAAETTGVSHTLIQTGPEAVITNQRPKYLSGDALLPMFQSNSGKSAKRPRTSSSKHGKSKHELHSEDGSQDDSDDDDSDASPRVSKEEVALWKNKFDPQTRVYEYTPPPPTPPPPPQSDMQQDKPPVKVDNGPATGDVSENVVGVDISVPKPTDDITSNQSVVTSDSQLDSTCTSNKQNPAEECEAYAPDSNNSHCSYASTKCLIRVTGGWMKGANAKSRDKTHTNHIHGKVPDIDGISNHTNGQNDLGGLSLDHKLLRHELIALNHHIAHSAPKRRKTSSSNTIAGDDNNKEAAYCFIPLLDGGVRYTCVSYGDLTVDLTDDKTCGFCCSDCSDTAAAVPDTTTVQKGKKRKNAAIVVDPLADRYQLVPYFGSKSGETNRVTPNTDGEKTFSCDLHKQCLHMVENWEAASREHLFPSLTSECRVNVLDLVECSDLINTEESEPHNDEETPYVCSLCAKTGVHGLMVHYTIAPSKISCVESTAEAGEIVASADESLPLRIAHVPCLYQLYHSVDMYGITDEQLLSKDTTADDADKLSGAEEGGESDREDMDVVVEASSPPLLLDKDHQTAAVDELQVAKDEESEDGDKMSTCAETQEISAVGGSEAKDDSLLAVDTVIESTRNVTLGGVHETRSQSVEAAHNSPEEVSDDAPETTTIDVDKNADEDGGDDADNAVDSTDVSDTVEKMDPSPTTAADCGMKTSPSDDEVEKEAKESASGNKGHHATISEPETNSESPSNSTGAQRTVIKHVTGSFSNDLRCCLCGVKSGLVVRCSVSNCFTAAHPFCVSSTSANNDKAAIGVKGRFYKVSNVGKEQESSSYICSVHAL